METIGNYKGYSVTRILNKKIECIINDNTFHTDYNEVAGVKIHLRYEPPMKFVFNGYEQMVKFIDENPR